jgi:hypothetical protein
MYSFAVFSDYKNPSEEELQASSDENIQDVDHEADGSDNELPVTNVTNDGKNNIRLQNKLCTILHSHCIFYFVLLKKMKKIEELKMKKAAGQILLQEKGKGKVCDKYTPCLHCLSKSNRSNLPIVSMLKEVAIIVTKYFFIICYD